MKIIISGSMSVSKKMAAIGEDLIALGHKVVLPKGTKEYAQGRKNIEFGQESIKNKIEHDLIKDYFNEIKNSDALLVVNIEKNRIKNYIGGNTFLEIGFAHALDKKIFLLNDIPDISYKDELIAMQPTIIYGDLGKI